MKKIRYYMSRYNEQEKFIKQLPDSCEVIQTIGGRKIKKKFPAPYPPGDEELVEIPAHEYYHHLQGAVEE